LKIFKLKFPYGHINRPDRKKISTTEVKRILESLEIKVTMKLESGFTGKCKTLSCRVTREADVIEEILRFMASSKGGIIENLKY